MNFPNNWTNIHESLIARRDDLLVKRNITEFSEKVKDVVRWNDGLHWYCGYADVRLILFRGKDIKLNIPYLSDITVFNLITGEEVIKTEFVTHGRDVDIFLDENGNYMIEVVSAV